MADDLRQRLELFRKLELVCQISVKGSREHIEGRIERLTDREVILKGGKAISIFDIEWVLEPGDQE